MMLFKEYSPQELAKLWKQREKVLEKANEDQAPKAKRRRKSNAQPVQDNVQSSVSEDEDLVVEESQTTITVGKVAAQILCDVTDHVRKMASDLCVVLGKEQTIPFSRCC